MTCVFSIAPLSPGDQEYRERVLWSYGRVEGQLQGDKYLGISGESRAADDK